MNGQIQDKFRPSHNLAAGLDYTMTFESRGANLDGQFVF